MKRIRSGKGLGDNLYLHNIVAHLVEQGEQLEVCTNYPALFPFDVSFAPWSRERIDYTCHYIQNKANPATTQFEDMCSLAKVSDVEYRARWRIRESQLVNSVWLNAGCKPILLVNGGRWPMDRVDGYGRELLPDAKSFNRVLTQLGKHFYTVFVGCGPRLFDVPVNLDLNDWTSPDEVMDLALAADAGFGQCGFMIPLMEMFNKPLMVMFTGRGFRSEVKFISQIIPKKLLAKESSTYVVDEWQDDRLDRAVESFCNPGASGREVQRQVRSGCR